MIKRYTAQAPDELSFEVRLWGSRLQLGSPHPLLLLTLLLPPAPSQVGDIVSVIDMPPTEDRSWWRGKRGFQVSPAGCRQVGLGHLPTGVAQPLTLTFLRLGSSPVNVWNSSQSDQVRA